MSTAQEFATTRYAAALAQAEKDETARRESGLSARAARIADQMVVALITKKDAIIAGQRHVIKRLRAEIAQTKAVAHADPDLRAAVAEAQLKERDEMIDGLRATIARLQEGLRIATERPSVQIYDEPLIPLGRPRQTGQ